jgi:hypothetical protein
VKGFKGTGGSSNESISMSLSEVKEEDVGEGGPMFSLEHYVGDIAADTRKGNQVERGKAGLGGGRKPCPAQARCSKSLIPSCSPHSSKSTFRPSLDKPVVRSERSSAHSETTLSPVSRPFGSARPSPDPMSSLLDPYSQVHPFRPQTVKNPPDAVPPTEELELLQTELKELRGQTLKRAKKAEDDLRTIEESMRRLKEREKGKAKVVEKMKRECASLLSLAPS